MPTPRSYRWNEPSELGVSGAIVGALLGANAGPIGAIVGTVIGWLVGESVANLPEPPSKP